MSTEYVGHELEGRKPIDRLEFESRHDPQDSLVLTYYLKTSGDLTRVAKEVARDETTGGWIGAGQPTETFLAAQADVKRIDIYGDDECVIQVHSPVRNMDLDSDFLYQFLMLTIGGPILEFVYYQGVAFLDFQLPASVMKRLPGPQFGVRGTKEILKLDAGTPIIGTIVKPCAGLTTQEVAQKCREAGLGGVRFIKDDEKMLGPSYCPQEEKVKAVAKALRESESATGLKTIYAPHVVCPPHKMADVCRRLIDWGATGLMFNPIVHGLGTLKALAEDPRIRVPLYAHSGGRSGWSTGPRRVDDVVMAKLIRLAGGDYFQIGVMGQKECHVASLSPRMLLRLKTVFTEPMGGFKDTVPVTAGGLNARNLVDNLAAFGPDIMALAGSNILKHPLGIKAGVDAMLQAAEAFRRGVSVEEYAKDHEALAVALKG
jgi:ribulose 1,5-bisphosphate carboxylase large subunit-like protein